MKNKLTGYEAIEAKEQNDWIALCKYNDPTEGARENLTVAEAREIAKEDPSLIYAVRYTPEDIATEAALSQAANEEGTIQAGDMLRLAPHHRPELHTTMSVSRAFQAITGKPYDTDFFCD